MSPMYRPNRAVLGASVAALTVLAATACGPDNSDPVTARTTAPTVAAGATGKPGAAPIKLPTAEELKTWKFEDWDKWAQQNVITPAVKGYWTLQRILNAKPKPMPQPQPQPDPTQPPAQPTGAAPAQPTSKPAAPAPAQPTTAQPPSTGDALPTVIEAKPTQHPFAKNLHVNGKLFFKDGNEDYVCSGTVVSDPANPGKSNLVWTASHCLNGGKGGTYYTNISFAPAYNSNGLLSGGKQANETAAEPYGEWGATAAWSRRSGRPRPTRSTAARGASTTSGSSRSPTRAATASRWRRPSAAPCRSGSTPRVSSSAASAPTATRPASRSTASSWTTATAGSR